jgi:hypothetical protein
LGAYSENASVAVFAMVLATIAFPKKEANPQKLPQKLK